MNLIYNMDDGCHTNLLVFLLNYYLINLEVVVVGEPPEYWRVDLNSVPQIVTDPNPGSSSPWEVEELDLGLLEDHLDHQEEVEELQPMEAYPSCYCLHYWILWMMVEVEDQDIQVVLLDHQAREACFQEVEVDSSSHCCHPHCFHFSGFHPKEAALVET